MKAGEIIGRNIGLTFDFLRHLVDHPEQVDNIPDGAIVEFLEKDFPKTIKSGARHSRKRTYVNVISKLEIV